MSTLALWEAEETRWLETFTEALRAWDGDAIQRVAIYMDSERPSLIVNTEDLSTFKTKDHIKVDDLGENFLTDIEDAPRGFFLGMDLLALKKAVQKYVPDAWNIFRSSNDNPDALQQQILEDSGYWDPQEGIEDDLLEMALTDSTGALILAEVIWVYRLAHRLRDEFPDVAFYAAVHDSFDELHEELWKLAGEFRSQPLSAWLAQFGLLAA